MIPDISKILYASDLGDSSRPAFVIAVQEALKHNAQIIFLNVVEPVNETTAALLGGALGSQALIDMRAEGIGKLKSLMNKRFQQFCTEELQGREALQHGPVFRVEEGPAAETIIQIAAELDVDLIVMGTRTRTHSTLGRFFVGSTAQSVLQLCDRPMLIVPLKDR